jgi:hypothetical protein
LQYFFCGSTLLSSIPELPDSIYYVNISSNTNLTCFPKYKKINNLPL